MPAIDVGEQSCGVLAEAVLDGVVDDPEGTVVGTWGPLFAMLHRPRMIALRLCNERAGSQGRNGSCA
jgi:hypothetical protein